MNDRFLRHARLLTKELAASSCDIAEDQTNFASTTSLLAFLRAPLPHFSPLCHAQELPSLHSRRCTISLCKKKVCTSPSFWLPFLDPDESPLAASPPEYGQTVNKIRAMKHFAGKGKCIFERFVLACFVSATAPGQGVCSTQPGQRFLEKLTKSANVQNAKIHLAGKHSAEDMLLLRRLQS